MSGNGKCHIQDGGCLEVQLLNTRVENMEDFVEDYKEEQKYARRWQKSTFAGVAISVALILFKILVG